MTDTTPQTPMPPTERVHMSCPGCGRNDWVDWPVGQETLQWKCFNCHKESVLTRHGRH